MKVQTFILFFHKIYREVVVINISIEELKRKSFNEHLNIIDIRSRYKYINGTINGATYIDENDLLYNNQKYLKKNEEYYLLCDNGFRSLKISKMLNSLGYKTYSIDGGYSKYVLEK